MPIGYKSVPSSIKSLNISCYLPFHGRRVGTAMRLSQATWIVLIFLLLVVSQPAFAEKVLFSAEYEGTFSGMTIKSTRRLIAEDGGRYRFESIINNALASIIEKSQFELAGGLILPLHYHYKRSIMTFKADETINFDWQNGIAKYRRKKKEKKSRDYAISPGVLDPALYQLQLQRDLFSHKSEMSYQFVKSNKVKSLVLTTKGVEEISLANKHYQAIKIEPLVADSKSQTRLWVVPELNYQIARIEHTEKNGETYNIYLTAYTSSPDLLEKILRNNPSSVQTQ